jgi:hypothetical protein
MKVVSAKLVSFDNKYELQFIILIRSSSVGGALECGADDPVSVSTCTSFKSRGDGGDG